jgi:hypothetical protein
MRKIKSLSTPHPSQASQSLPITPTHRLPPSQKKKKKKRVVEATKIHPHRRPTKPPSTERKSTQLSRKFGKHRTQPSKHTVINSRRASTPMGVTCVHCGAREIKKRAFVWLWFSKKKILMGEDDDGGVVMGDEDDKEYIWQHFPP